MESAFTIVVPDTDVLSRLCGTNDCNLRLIEEHLGVPVFTRGNELSVSETDPDVHRRFKYIIDRIVDEVANGNEADDQMVYSIFKRISGGLGGFRAFGPRYARFFCAHEHFGSRHGAPRVSEKQKSGRTGERNAQC